MKYFLECTKCGMHFDEKYKRQVCSACGAILDVKYKKFNFSSDRKKEGMWAYEDMLPDAKYRHYAVGGTKLLQSNENPDLFLKLEIQNPTRSFKDRGSVVEISKCLEYGYKEIVCASTGNMAFSIAYFAKLNNIKSKIFISNDANNDKIKDIKNTHSASITKINGDFNLAQKFAEKYAAKNNAFLAGDYCYRKEGQKTVAYEIIEEAEPSNILVPIGNATLIYGMLQAIKEMKDAGAIKKSPKIIGVQAELCSPFVKAFGSGKNIKYEKPRTMADAIAVGYPTFGDMAIEKLRKNQGEAVSVTEKEMMQEQQAFYKEYGLVAEMAGVAAIAGFKKMNLKGKSVAVISGGNV
jgi:threonine synthase